MPAWPAPHEPQSLLALYCKGHAAHAGPLHWFRHVQLHPVRVLPRTLTALPLQFAPTVHVSRHAGYVS
jgi:hypothetical protein